MANNNDNTGWTFEKKMPVTLLVTVILQTFTGIWWAATLTRDMQYLKEKLADQLKSSYSASRATLEIGFLKEKIKGLEMDVTNIKKEQAEMLQRIIVIKENGQSK